MKKADGDRRPNSFHTWWMRYYTYTISAEKVKGFLSIGEPERCSRTQSPPLRMAKDLLPHVVDESMLIRTVALRMLRFFPRAPSNETH